MSYTKKQILEFYSQLPNSELKEGIAKYINICIKQDLPIIMNLGHLALIVNLHHDVLKRMIVSSHSFYYRFEIPKRSGGKREINKPYPSLMTVQRWIYLKILIQQKQHTAANAFVQKKSIIDHVKPHIGSKALLKIDVKDFFPSIRTERVIEVFKRIGYPYHIAKILALACLRHGALPQGAPTSPCISNLVFISLDHRLSSLADSVNLAYTRYADDMVFSGDFIYPKFYKLVSSIIEEEGFSLNTEKTQLIIGEKKKIITGISISSGKMKLPQARKRKWRKEIYFYLKNNAEITNASSYLKIYQILGKLNFWNQIEPDNAFLNKSMDSVKKLLSNRS